jgi:hypothetical protein
VPVVTTRLSLLMVPPPSRMRSGRPRVRPRRRLPERSPC